VGITLPSFHIEKVDLLEHHHLGTHRSTETSFYSNCDEVDNHCFYKIDKILNMNNHSSTAINLLQDIDALNGLDMFKSNNLLLLSLG
jgi:hypothetical protein